MQPTLGPGLPATSSFNSMHLRASPRLFPTSPTRRPADDPKGSRNSLDPQPSSFAFHLLRCGVQPTLPEDAVHRLIFLRSSSMSLAAATAAWLAPGGQHCLLQPPARLASPPPRPPADRRLGPSTGVWPYIRARRSQCFPVEGGPRFHTFHL